MTKNSKCIKEEIFNFEIPNDENLGDLAKN